jgi:hypothetical protein
MNLASRRIWASRLTLILVGSGVLGGCSLTTTSTPEASLLPLRPGDVVLVTHRPFDEAVPMACAGVGLDAVVNGDPTDPRVAWLVNRHPGAGRIEVAWPPGFRARFVPELEIVDGSGQVRMRQGDHVDGTCGTVEDGAVILALSFPGME